jgi:hypothetical protein
VQREYGGENYRSGNLATDVVLRLLIMCMLITAVRNAVAILKRLTRAIPCALESYCFASTKAGLKTKRKALGSVWLWCDDIGKS